VRLRDASLKESANRRDVLCRRTCVFQQNFIDMEKLLELLDQNVEVQDAPDAKELVVTKGELEFGACRGAHRRSPAPVGRLVG